MASTTPSTTLTDDVAKETAAAVASALLPKPKRNGVQTVSDKPATRKPAKAKPAVPAKWQTVDVNGKKVKVDGNLNKADARKAARAALRALNTPAADTDRPATTRATRTPRPRGPLPSFEARVAAKPNSPRKIAFENAVAKHDADFLLMFKHGVAAKTPAARARAVAGMHAAIRTLYKA